ncbi:MAG: DUF1343 domain-containing protein [Saprospiraceae bacterium]|nr:DUF1343 domain-containing protein [Saprospiraceae bacterium]
MIQIGLQRLIAENNRLLKGRNVGLVTHAAAVTSDFTSTVDFLLKNDINLKALFGPEHGFDGAGADASPMEDVIDTRTGLPIFSLYGASKKPSSEALDLVDVLIFDMQDVGARFYTFISTLAHVMRAAVYKGLELIVLDRPNPINGLQIEGPFVEDGFYSFISEIPIPIRHGMTVGELAQWIAYFEKLDLQLTVIPMHGWSRAMWWDETGLPWIPLSPGMAHFSTAIVYPGACLIEGTNLSEGRGTALPFEILGAPWLDGYALAKSLNELELQGVCFRPHAFIPTFGKYQDVKCGGVQVHITDRNALQPVEMGLHLLAACRSQNPGKFEFLTTSWEGEPPHLDLLIGTSSTRIGLEKGLNILEITSNWKAIEKDFYESRRPFLLYQ